MFSIYQIWILWFLNQYFNNIILLSFLIAIIGQSYTSVIQNSQMFEYEHKAQLNEEIMRIRNYFNRDRAFDLISILSPHSQDIPAEREQLATLAQIVQNQSDVSQNMMKLRDELTKLKSDNDKRFDKMKLDVDAQFQELVKIIGRFQGQTQTQLN